MYTIREAWSGEPVGSDAPLFTLALVRAWSESAARNGAAMHVTTDEGDRFRMLATVTAWSVPDPKHRTEE